MSAQRMNDWDSYARKLEAALDMRGGTGFRDLFAPGARFADPANPPTEDLRDIQQQTRKVFPDWHQEITSIRGGDHWAVFEWIGRGTFNDTTPITMHGATIIELDGDGRITSWRDYLDRKEPEDQIRKAMKAQ
jgi:ketosteroid isomerase-like protein